MNYSIKSKMVRVDFFKELGKWYDTCNMEWLDYDGLIHDCFTASLHKAFTSVAGIKSNSDMTAVCLEPCHKNSHTLMLHN